MVALQQHEPGLKRECVNGGKQYGKDGPASEWTTRRAPDHQAAVTASSLVTCSAGESWHSSKVSLSLMSL